MPCFGNPKLNVRAERTEWFSRHSSWLIFIICLVSFIVFRAVTDHPFLAYDDGFFVTENGYVRQGLTWSSVVWSWTATLGFYHPLTWLSLMLDSTMFGLNPATFHLTNLWLHLANTALLYCFLKRATGEVARSLAVAALFAWHPINVESVAWIAERKGLLSTFFALLSLIAYVHYAERRSALRYLLFGTAMLLSLLSKSMAVILPGLFLVLDYWPLERVLVPSAKVPVGRGISGSKAPFNQVRLLWRANRWLIVEKIPLFLVALIFIALTIKAESNVGAIRSIDQFTLGERALNVTAAVPLYLKQLLLPYQYAPYYPIPPWSQPELFLFIMISVGLIWLCFRSLGQRPPLAAGILWFLICLSPVIGIIKIGSHLMADRYVYLAQVGVFVALVWTIPSVGRVPARVQMAGFACVAAVLLLTTHRQLPVWKDDLSLALHGKRVTGKNAVVCYGLGIGYELAGDREQSLRYFREVTEYAADYAGVHYNIARAYVIGGKPKRALVHLDRALRQTPTDARYHNLVAEILSASNDPTVRNAIRAVEHASLACRQVQSSNPLFLDTLAAAYAEAGQFSDAIVAATGALRLTASEEVRKRINERIHLYSQGKPFRGILLHDAAVSKK